MNTRLASILSVIKMAIVIFFNKATFPIYFILGIAPPMLFIIISQISILCIKTNTEIIQIIGKTIFASPGGIFLYFVLMGVILIFPIVLLAWYIAMLYNVHISLVYSQPKNIREYLRLGWVKTGHYLSTVIIRNLIVLFGFLFFIIPGILFLLWYQFTPIIAAIEEKNIDTFKTSKLIVMKYFWPLLGRQILIGSMYGIPFYVFNMIHPYVGLVWTLSAPFFSLIMVIIYLNAKQVYSSSVSNVTAT